MPQSEWNAAAIPDLTGSVAIVTGASSGLGEETARVLAEKSAKVILAVRDTTKGAVVADRIRAAIPGADVSVGELDLASLASVKAFSETVLATEPRAACVNSEPL